METLIKCLDCGNAVENPEYWSDPVCECCYAPICEACIHAEDYKGEK